MPNFTDKPINILVTGGCGFIGSNFINYYFNKYNYNIVCIDALYYCASIMSIDENIRKSYRYTFIHGNLTDYELVFNTLKNFEITHVIHFAAQSHVDNSFNDSLQYTEDNVKGTHTLLEAIRNVSPDILLLHFSTDEVYGESLIDSDIMKTETSMLCPTNPYAASKAAAEMYVISYIHSFKMKAIITRGNNVYGKNQYPEKLIPKFIMLLKTDQKCTIHGKGSTVRNFINVYDVCTAVDIILEHGKIGEIYNIGGNKENEYSVLQIAQFIIKAMKNTTEYDNYIEYVTDRPFNDMRYFISSDKIAALGWVQTINFTTGLNSII